VSSPQNSVRHPGYFLRHAVEIPLTTVDIGLEFCQAIRLDSRDNIRASALEISPIKQSDVFESIAISSDEPP
jgi:hypothetical protein